MRLLYAIFSIIGAAGASAASGSLILARNDVTELSNFAQTLGLSETQIQSLEVKYSQATTRSTIVEVACLAAQLCLGTDQVDTTPVNQTIVEENWSETCIESPSCIILPATSDHVSKTLQIINFFQAPFAVRSGGHSPNPGWSSIQDGILISLEKLNTVSLSKDRTFASVGPGARWGEVFATLDAQQAVVVGTRLPDVGVGGSLLGGGFFHISGEFGLAADNVKNFEVVLGSGNVINANASQNSNLFWALKGGSANFGIVTRYDLYTIPVYEIWGQITIYAPDQAFEVLAAFDDWQLNGSSDIKSSVSLTITLDSITVGLTYSEPANLPDVFSPFYKIPPLFVAVPSFNTTFAVVNQILASAFPTFPARHDYRGSSTEINANLTRDVYNFWRPKALAARTATGINQTFTIQHVTQNMVQQGINKGGNALGLPLKAQQWWTTLIDWDNEVDDDLARSVSIETTAQWDRLSKERGLHIPFLFLNDASRDQNPLATYGTSNLDKLKQISQSYDPNQIFQKLQNGGFLLSKA